MEQAAIFLKFQLHWMKFQLHLLGNRLHSHALENVPFQLNLNSCVLKNTMENWLDIYAMKYVPFQLNLVQDLWMPRILSLMKQAVILLCRCSSPHQP